MDTRRKLHAYLRSMHTEHIDNFTQMRITQNKKIVLFLHGIQGKPSWFQWLIEEVPQDTDYISILLPGHGGSGAAFLKCGRADWERTVFTVLEKVLPLYEQIDLVGHSMGCLLWTLARQKYPDRFHSYLFFGCPFAVRPTLQYLINNFFTVWDIPFNNVYTQSSRIANCLSHVSPLAYPLFVKPYLGLLSLIRETRKVSMPPFENGMAFWGTRDEIVHSASLSHPALRGFQTARLPNCGHNYMTNEAYEITTKHFLRLISQSK